MEFVVETCDFGHQYPDSNRTRYGCPVCLRIGLTSARAEQSEFRQSVAEALAELRADIAANLCREDGKWLTATEKTTNQATESALAAVDATIAKLGLDAAKED